MRINCLINLLIIITTQFTFTVSDQNQNLCPKSEILLKFSCICYPYGAIQCNGTENIKYKHMFEELSQQSINGNKHFKAFVLYNSAITQIEENFFSGITFDQIIIDRAMNLTSINTNAFNGTNLVTNLFRMSKTSYENPDIFHTLSKMRNLRDLYLEIGALEEIPSFAFKSAEGYLDGLRHAYFLGMQLNKISSNAFFGLNSLVELLFAYRSIDSIQSNAFQLSEESNETLKISLGENVLEGSVLDNNAFLNIRRPVNLVHECYSYPCQLKYLNETIFAPFFDENTENIIRSSSGDYIHIDCHDCRSYWLINPKYLTRTQFMRCKDNVLIGNHSNFKSCS